MAGANTHDRPGARRGRLRASLRLAAAVLVVAALAVSALAAIVRFWPDWTWSGAHRALEREYGIDILLDDIDFPDFFRAQGARYHATLGIERRAVLRRLALDLSRYPRSFVERHLDSIAVLRSLELDGQAYGGTYDAENRRIYIDSGWLGDDGTRPEAMGLHHEFSSLLMHRYPEVFDTGAWAALNPEGFEYRYAASGSDNLASGQLDLVGDAAIWSKGFLCAYGQLTVEDDINTFSQYLVAAKHRWPDLSREHTRLEDKMMLLTTWFCAIGYRADGVECAANAPGV